jgi:hypothetical protein
MLLGIIRQCLKRKKLIAEIRTDDITIENPVINIIHMENLINVIECLKDLLIIEEIVMATISKIITTNIDLLMTDTVAEMMQGLNHIVD